MLALGFGLLEGSAQAEYVKPKGSFILRDRDLETELRHQDKEAQWGVTVDFKYIPVIVARAVGGAVSRPSR